MIFPFWLVARRYPEAPLVSFCAENLKAVFIPAFLMVPTKVLCLCFDSSASVGRVSRSNACLSSTLRNCCPCALYFFTHVLLYMDNCSRGLCDMYIWCGWIRWAVSANLSVKCQDLMFSHIKSKPVKRHHLETTFSSNANGITESRGTIVPDQLVSLEDRSLSAH